MPYPTTGTVYLIAQPSVKRDGALPKLEPLAAWGQIKVLIHPGEDPRYNPALALSRIRHRLEEFNPETDYLAWAGGDTLAAVLAGVVLADLSADENEPFESFNWLRFDRGDDGRGNRTDAGGRYVPIRVPLYSTNSAMISAAPNTLPDDDDGT